MWTFVTCQRSINSSAPRASHLGMITTDAPNARCIWAQNSGPMWYEGPTSRCTSPVSNPQRSFDAATATARRRKSSSPIATPLGRPVVPDVYAMTVGHPSPTTSGGSNSPSSGALPNAFLSFPPRPTTSRGTPATPSSAGWRSSATTTAVAPESATIQRASSALKWMFTGTTTAPRRPAPCTASKNSNEFGIITATRSPRCTPRAASACATRRARSSSSPYVFARSPWRSAIWSGRARAWAITPASWLPVSDMSVIMPRGHRGESCHGGRREDPAGQHREHAPVRGRRDPHLGAAPGAGRGLRPPPAHLRLRDRGRRRRQDRRQGRPRLPDGVRRLHRGPGGAGTVHLPEARQRGDGRERGRGAVPQRARGVQGHGARLMALLVGNVLRHAARYTPRSLAATLGDDEVAFGELDDQANRVAHTLAGMGVGPGERVAWWGDTSLEALPVFFALARLGAVFAPVNAPLGPEEAAEVIGYARTRLVVVDDAHAPLVQEIDDAVVTHAHLADAAAHASAGEVDPNALDERDPHVIFFTSGSTARPKG